MNTATTTESRAEILREIAEHERRIFELRQMLPTCLKSFWRFRCRPERFVFIYAETRDEAERKLRAKMNREYGDSWEVVSGVVDQFLDPATAANHSPGSLCRAIGEADAIEFIRDWRASRASGGDTENRPKLKNLPANQLETDIEHFELFLRRRDA